MRAQLLVLTNAYLVDQELGPHHALLCEQGLVGARDERGSQVPMAVIAVLCTPQRKRSGTYGIHCCATLTHTYRKKEELEYFWQSLLCSAGCEWGPSYPLEVFTL
jgi:hypothetical protein